MLQLTPVNYLPLVPSLRLRLDLLSRRIQLIATRFSYSAGSMRSSTPGF